LNGCVAEDHPPDPNRSVYADRHRIARSGESSDRHRISPRNVGPIRHPRRGLVTVLPPLRQREPSPRSAQPRPCSSIGAGVFRNDLLSPPRTSLIGSPEWSGGGRARGWGPSAASSVGLCLGTTRRAVGPRPQNRHDALSEKTARCAVGPHVSLKTADKS